MYTVLSSVLDTVGWMSGEYLACKQLSDEALAWFSGCSEVQMICMWSSWCHCHSISRFVKIQIVLITCILSPLQVQKPQIFTEFGIFWGSHNDWFLLQFMRNLTWESEPGFDLPHKILPSWCIVSCPQGQKPHIDWFWNIWARYQPALTDPGYICHTTCGLCFHDRFLGDQYIMSPRNCRGFCTRACLDHLTKWSMIVTSSTADRDQWSWSKVPPSVAQVKLLKLATVLAMCGWTVAVGWSVSRSPGLAEDGKKGVFLLAISGSVHSL